MQLAKTELLLRSFFLSLPVWESSIIYMDQKIVLYGWTSFCGEKIGAEMNNQPVIIVDADAIIAQTNPEDVHHQKANVVSRNLIEMNALVIYPATAIAEAATHMQRVLNSTASAYGTAQLMSEADAQV